MAVRGFGLFRERFAEFRDSFVLIGGTACELWLADLNRLQADGEPVDDSDIKKHRNDVFRLAAALPGVSGAPPPACIAADLSAFLGRFPLDHADWGGIRHSIRNTIRGPIEPAKLVNAVRTYYRLTG